MRVRNADFVENLMAVGQRDHHSTAAGLAAARSVVALGPTRILDGRDLVP
jgi:hypothetical protein